MPFLGGFTLGVAPSQDASGKWRSRLESPTKYEIFLVVTVTGKGPHPRFTCLLVTPSTDHASSHHFIILQDLGKISPSWGRCVTYVISTTIRCIFGGLITKLLATKNTPMRIPSSQILPFLPGFLVMQTSVSSLSLYPRDSITLSKDDGGIHSPPQRIVFRFHWKILRRWLDP